MLGNHLYNKRFFLSFIIFHLHHTIIFKAHYHNKLQKKPLLCPISHADIQHITCDIAKIWRSVSSILRQEIKSRWHQTIIICYHKKLKQSEFQVPLQYFFPETASVLFCSFAFFFCRKQFFSLVFMPVLYVKNLHPLTAWQKILQSSAFSSHLLQR